MQEKLVNFKTAMLAENKGFKEDTFFYYIKDSGEFINTRVGKLGSYDDCSRNPSFGYTSKEVVSAPTLSLLQKWLRDVHNIHVDIEHWVEQPVEDEVWDHAFSAIVDFDIMVDLGIFKTYEEALEVGLNQALKLIK